MTRNWREDKKNSHERGYNYRWKKYRDGFLRNNPLCVMCNRKGIQTIANVVDHIIPHRGDKKLFWDKSNHQSICSHCHNSTKQRMEKRGVDAIGCDEDGNPLSRQHHWHS